LYKASCTVEDGIFPNRVAAIFFSIQLSFEICKYRATSLLGMYSHFEWIMSLQLDVYKYKYMHTNTTHIRKHAYNTTHIRKNTYPYIIYKRYHP
jgi:hypothetical protein